MSMMPALFIGHGSPMNTLQPNHYTQAWQMLGQNLPRPEALLVISAHWYIDVTAVTAMAQPRTIHDFYGFPQALFDFQYPATGSPELAHEVARLLAPEPVVLDAGQWGLDHGTWSVLAHLYPEADIPVVQLSINGRQTPAHYLALGARLSALRQQGVMVLASGNIVHNLRMMQRQSQDMAYDWAKRFDEAVIQQMQQAPADILRLLEHPDYQMAVPTPDHFMPLVHLAGLATASNSQLLPLIRGCSMGSISMTCFGLDVAAM